MYFIQFILRKKERNPFFIKRAFLRVGKPFVTCEIRPISINLPFRNLPKIQKILDFSTTFHIWSLCQCNQLPFFYVCTRVASWRLLPISVKFKYLYYMVAKQEQDSDWMSISYNKIKDMKLIMQQSSSCKKRKQPDIKFIKSAFGMANTKPLEENTCSICLCCSLLLSSHSAVSSIFKFISRGHKSWGKLSWKGLLHKEKRRK